MNKKLNLVAAAAAMMGSLPAAAWDTHLGENTQLQIDSRYTMGAAWRVESNDKDYIGIGNGGNAYSNNADDAELAFSSGDVVSAAAKLTSDLTLSHGRFGVFLRGSYLFNARLDDKSFFDSDNYYVTPTGPGVGLTATGRPSVAPIEEYRRRTNRVQDNVGNDADMLDAYLYGAVDLGNRELAFKLGRQIVNWGESTLVLNGINSILAFDANQLRVPGADIDEVIKPLNMAWLSMGLWDGVAAEAFYQFDWQRTDPDAPGTYWSTNDFVGVGGTRAFITFGLPPENTPNTTIPRAADNTPKKSGQFGGKLSFMVPALNDMDLSLYAMKYHSRLPLVSGISKSSFASTSETGFYFVEYPEDIQLYGLSFNSTVGDWSVQGEYSYKVDQPFQVDDVELLLAGVGLPSQVTPPPAAPLGSALGNKYIRGYRRHDVSQADIGFTRLFGPMRWIRSEQMIFIAEVAGLYIHDLPPESQLRYDAPGTYGPGDAAVAALVSASTLPALGRAVPQQQGGYGTDFSWGYRLVARLTYNNVFDLFRIEPSLRFDHDVHGITPNPLVTFIEDRKSASVRLTASYRQAWSADFGYTSYFGGGASNLLADRDYVDVVLRYIF